MSSTTIQSTGKGPGSFIQSIFHQPMKNPDLKAHSSHSWVDPESVQVFYFWAQASRYFWSMHVGCVSFVPSKVFYAKAFSQKTGDVLLSTHFISSELPFTDLWETLDLRCHADGIISISREATCISLTIFHDVFLYSFQRKKSILIEFFFLKKLT